MKTLILTLLLVSLAQSAIAQTIQVRIGNNKIIGKPVFWNDYAVSVIEQDGKISQFSAQEAKDYKVLSKSFRFYSKWNFEQISRKNLDAVSRCPARDSIWSCILEGNATNGPIDSRNCIVRWCTTMACVESRHEG